MVPYPNCNPFERKTADGGDLAQPNSTSAPVQLETPDTNTLLEPNSTSYTFQSRTSVGKTAAAEQSQAVYSGNSSEPSSSSSSSALHPQPADPFSIRPATLQPIFRFGAGQSSESSPSSSAFELSRFHAIKRTPTGQNERHWQRDRSPPQIPRIIVTAPSNASNGGFLEREQQMDFQKGESSGTSQFAMSAGEMNEVPGFASGSAMSSVGPSQHDEQIGAEPQAPEAENHERQTIGQIPDVRVDGVRLADVDEFIWHFAGYVRISLETSPPFHAGTNMTLKAGAANPPRDRDESLDGMIKVLTNWNSIFTIYAAPAAEDSHWIGDQVGQHLAIRLVCKSQAGLLKPLAEYFQGMVDSAEREIENLSAADMKDYEEHREMSWLYMQLMQRRFAKQARVRVIEIGKMEALKQQESREMRRRVAGNQNNPATPGMAGSGNDPAKPGTLLPSDKGKENNDGEQA
jgi:hypothetical protein